MRLGKLEEKSVERTEIMKNKRKLKNIANGILSSFLSRNNDVNGYWGIGKLYSLILKEKMNIVTIDLLNKTINPKDEEFNYLINQYREKLIVKLVKKEISLINIKKALIVIETDTINVNSNSKLNTLKCGLLIEDTELVKGFIQKDIKCRSHNPKSEMKSSRNYGNK